MQSAQLKKISELCNQNKVSFNANTVLTLAFIQENKGTATLRRCAEYLQLSQTASMHIIDALETLGYTSRKKNTDRRVNNLTITKAGNTFLKSIGFKPSPKEKNTNQ